MMLQAHPQMRSYATQLTKAKRHAKVKSFVNDETKRYAYDRTLPAEWNRK